MCDSKMYYSNCFTNLRVDKESVDLGMEIIESQILVILNYHISNFHHCRMKVKCH